MNQGDAEAHTDDGIKAASALNNFNTWVWIVWVGNSGLTKTQYLKVHLLDLRSTFHQLMKTLRFF